jgi:cytoskeleton protein RodZ
VPYELKLIPRKPDAGSSGSEAARVGEELRDSRLALGLSVEEVAVRLRIRRAYLEALEEGRIGDLPAPAYAIGFIRSYATALGLDPDEMVRRFRDLSGPVVTDKTRLVFPEPVPERGVPAGAVIAVGAVICIGAYVTWYNWSGAGDRTVDAVPPVPPRLEQAAEDGRAQLPGRDGAAPRPDPGALPLAALPPPGGIAAAPPPLPQQPSANTSAQAATVPAAPPPPVVAAAPPPQLIPGLPDGTRVALRARAGSPEGAWVSVRDPRTGQSLLNKVLRPGEVWPVPPREGLLLDTGKADALEIVVDNEFSPIFEGVVGVRRNIRLEPDRLRQRLVPASAAAAPRAN